MAGIFSLSVLVIAFAVVRVIQSRPTTKQHVDPVWLALWSMIEASVGKQRDHKSTFHLYSADV